METPAPVAALGARQLFGSPTSHVHPPHCTAFDLPASGILVINGTSTITLATDAVFQPFCTDIASLDPNNTLPITDFQTPFLGSTVPQIFVIGAMLVTSWTLVIIIIITPRTSFMVGSGAGFIVPRSILGSGYGRNKSIGAGGRPLLQKIATMTVFVSLLIATVNSFNVAANQYAHGYEDAVSLTQDVVGSLEIRIIRVISETCLWLAQVQTLIRLFPRRKEKIIIMWSGFALILLDTLFSILDSFVADISGETIVSRPGNFDNVIPALSYLFHLALSFVYACSVLYYSLVKRRFAYYHTKMKNISVVALLSLMSIAVPVIFFVLDVAQPLVLGWGDYVRWVGAAAASVVVWEWVERIEALEREDGKDGILGREILEGEEPLDSTSPTDPSWPGGPQRRRKRRRDDGHANDRSRGHRPFGTGSMPSRTTGLALSSIMSRVTGAGRGKHKGPPASAQVGAVGSATSSGFSMSRVAPPAIPPPSVSPIARSDTTSAASTIYAVIHHGSDEAARMGPSPAVLGPLRSATSASPGVMEPAATTSSPSGSSAPSSRTSSGFQQSRSPPQQNTRSNLSQSWTRGEDNQSPAAAPSIPLTSTPSSTGTTPPLSRSNTSSRLLSRFRRTPTEPVGDLPTFIIRGGGQSEGDDFVLEPKEKDAVIHRPSPTRTASQATDSPSAYLASSGSPDPVQQAGVDTSSPSPVRHSTSPGNLRERQSPPPVFSGNPRSGSSTASNTPDSAVDARTQCSSNGSRASRRSWANMPVVREDEPSENPAGEVAQGPEAPGGA